MACEADNEPRDEVLCSCSGTTRGMIHDLVMQGKDLDAISRYSGALTGCGGCEWDIADYISTLDSRSAQS